MITKKLWNSFDSSTRMTILAHMNGIASFIKQDLASNPYNHDFDFDATGRILKGVLGCLNLQKDGTVNVVIGVRPTYAPKTLPRKPASKTQTSLTPKKWYIDYRFPEGDEWSYEHCWVSACDKLEAESEFWHDHSRMCEIISIHQ